MQKLYGPWVNPLARIVQGVPTSWDPCIASKMFPNDICAVVWSPCSRFIAAAWNGSCDVAILDAVTLGKLHTMYPKNQWIRWSKLIFSPDSHLLTGYSSTHNCIISWDVQTGGLISNINTRETGNCGSMSYSECGTMLGGLFSEAITTYDILSGTQISSHPAKESVASTIWTLGKCLQFATVEAECISIWEVSFTSGHLPTQVRSLSTPTNFSKTGLVLLPTLSQLAFILGGRIIVWDAQHQKILLDSVDVDDPRNMSFSSDGHFLVYSTRSSELHLWKVSPDGYLPCQKFISNDIGTEPVVSPNGVSIISFGGSVLQLWHTTNSPTSTTSEAFQQIRHFLLEFSPDGSLVAFTRWSDETVTVLDLKSGNKQLTINADTMVCGIGITESRIVVVGDGKIIAWEIPREDHTSNSQKNIGDNVQITPFEHLLPIKDLWASMSSDSNYIAFGKAAHRDDNLYFYNMHTGKELVVARSHGWLPGFSLDGNQVWCATGRGEVNQWTIVRESGSTHAKLEKLGGVNEPPTGFPWHSSCGYQVTDDGWILSSRGKRLLWLPHPWRSAEAMRKWNGKFLALLFCTLPEVVILELEV